MMEEDIQPRSLDPKLDFLAGTFAGLTSLLVGFPFDTIKVRFQDPSTAIHYRSTFHALTKIIREERVSGLFKGVTAPMLGCGFLNGMVFGSYGFLMKSQLQNDHAEPSLRQIFVAGSGSGIIASFVTCPTELIKIQQQTTLTTPLPSVWRVTSDIWRTHGLRGLYRGFAPTIMRDAGYGVYFLTYEAVCRGFRHREAKIHSSDKAGSLAKEAGEDLPAVPWYGLLLAGGLAGPMSWLSTFPFDVIKTRMQTHIRSSVDSTKSKSPYATTLGTIAYCYRTEGLKVFFAGLAPTLIRAVPVNAVTFATFELVVGILS